MALVSCPECGKQISDSTPACPHCGYQFSVSGRPSSPAPTKIGDSEQNLVVGIVLVVLGVLCIPVALFAFIAFSLFGLLVVWVPIALLIAGISKIMGTRSISCPHCGKIAQVGKSFENYKCPVCKKRSVRDNDYLKPIL